MDWDRLYQTALELKDEVVEYYHELHRFPELSLQEYRTTEYIMSKLREMSLEPLAIDETGCIAYIGGPVADKSGRGEKEGEYTGKTIALRADIDALPVREETGLPFSSEREGVMHACGHDGHIAGLLGAAKVLKMFEKDLPVRVKLIFQAAEENIQGASRLIDRGVLSDVDLIFGLHLFSDIPTGTISADSGPRMARTDRFEIEFIGKSGHAAKPHLCKDATLMASSFVTELQSAVSREINPLSTAVVTVGSLHSGNRYNIISEKAVLEGTCRCYSPEVSRQLEDGIRRRAQGLAAAFGGSCKINYRSNCHPAVINDPAFSCAIIETGKERIGDSCFQSLPPSMLGEDFSWYQEKVPGVFAFVGCGKPGQEVMFNHHPCFKIDEDSLGSAILLHLCAVESAQNVGRGV